MFHVIRIILTVRCALLFMAARQKLRDGRVVFGVLSLWSRAELHLHSSHFVAFVRETAPASSSSSSLCLRIISPHRFLTIIMHFYMSGSPIVFGIIHSIDHGFNYMFIALRMYSDEYRKTSESWFKKYQFLSSVS
jgi:hypothetical protein